MAVPIDIQDEDHFEELLGRETQSDLPLTSHKEPDHKAIRTGPGINHTRDNR